MIIIGCEIISDWNQFFGKNKICGKIFGKCLLWFF